MGDENRTNVIVVGAGASQEFGLPTGAKLTEKLQGNLAFQVADQSFQTKPGNDRELFVALRDYAARQGKPVGPFQDAARFISANMALAPSIDNFLDTHKADEEIVLVGKIAIANAIMAAERTSKLFVDPSNIYNRMRFENLRETWASVFFRIIVAQRDYGSFLAAISNITFISFNYDRCIKQFFVHAAGSYFKLDREQKCEVMEALRVIHPYGSIGNLAVDLVRYGYFGEERNTDAILRATSEVRTFTEGVADPDTQKGISDALRGADLLIFLGYSFIDLNMRLLPGDGVSVERILATSKGRSSDTTDRIRNSLASDYAEGVLERIELFDGSCCQLFWEYDHYLTNRQT